MGSQNKTFVAVGSGIVALSAILATSVPAFANSHENSFHNVKTTTPIKHVVVIFNENVSFDHYFGTYPYAKNPKGEPQFHALAGTPIPNNYISHPNLLTHNLNSANPQRLDRSQPITDDMDHGYTAEQNAFDGGKMDKFVQSTGKGSWPIPNQSPSKVMDYYDGNTVTALWNYAQHFAMSDNSYGTTFGPSTPGALNLISGQTHGAVGYSASQAAGGTKLQSNSQGVIIKNTLNTNNTLYGDINPYFDNSSTGKTVKMTGKNVGNLLNAKGVTWGWFEGGFSNPSATHKNIAGTAYPDYSPHHEPFQYYKSTANPKHLPPSSIGMIGKTDQANHQYSMKNFWRAVDNRNMPAVSFLKAPMYQDGHAGYSDPLDEQHFIVNTINRLEKTPDWKNTAVILSYDDSDGWYDHQMSPTVNGSKDPLADTLFGKGNAGQVKLKNYQDRAGYGPRLPLMVISPYAKKNFIANNVTDQSSILKFIEDNWNLGRIGDGSYDAIAGSIDNMFNFKKGPHAPKLFLNPTTGEPASAQGEHNSKYAKSRKN